jgi:nucleoside phosphorylase
MTVDWRDTLRTLRTQFEAKAAASNGLYHLFTEVADSEREKCTGPPWFRPFERTPQIVDGRIKYDKWDCSSSGSLPSIEPGFRGVDHGEDVSSYPEEKLIRDRSGIARAVFVPMKLRQGFYCGPAAELASVFKSLASTAAAALANATDLGNHPFAADLKDLFRPPRSGVRYVFGEVTGQPNQFISRGWSAGVIQFESGVLIDVPISEHAADEGHWLLLLHRLGWRPIRGSMVRAKRFSWEGNGEVAFEILHWKSKPGGKHFADQFARFSTESFYSVLGSKETPDDLFLVSAFAINLLLSHLTDDSESNVVSANPADYSQQPWFTQPLPPLKSVPKDELSSDGQPKIGVVVATEVERQAVLKRMLPPKGRRTVVQVFDESNTFFLGRLGLTEIVLCMSSMGSTSRDASLAVTSETIDRWKLSGVIMVGIAFGKDAAMQRIGQVLISDQVVPYEPQRIGVIESNDRGVTHSAGRILINRFRNVLGWSFADPSGNPCGYQIGPLLSGEKLVDNPEFKGRLFERYPNSIGGEMEGCGVAAAAERRRCEWIVVKAICDWGDGTKSKHHQAFAAAASVHLVEHVLNQSGALDDLV